MSATREDTSKLSWVRMGIVVLASTPALLFYGWAACSAVVSLFRLSLLDIGFYLCIGIGVFVVVTIASDLEELRRDAHSLHDMIVSERLRASGRSFITRAENVADELEKGKTDRKISGLGRAIMWIVILAVSMNVLSHISNQRRLVASYRNWREGVVEGAAERSHGGGCGTVVKEYFDDLDQSADE
jgi:hypothetical protein